jgi:hypothetical protein
MRLDSLPYQAHHRIARHLARAFYVHTLGSASSAWRDAVRSHQAVVAAGHGDYARALARFPRADTLRLRLAGRGRVGLGHDGGVAALRAASGLRALRIAAWPRATVDGLARALAATPHLTTLDIDGVELDAGAFDAIAALGGLVALAMRNATIGVWGDATAALARALPRLNALTALDLASNYIDAAAATALAPSLRALTALTALDLRRNMLATGGAVALAPSLRALPALTALDVDANGIGAAGLAALSPS